MRAWLHVGTVTIEGTKMAKSAGNLVLTGDLLADHPAVAVRLMILGRCWADGWDYTPALLDAAAAGLESLYYAAGRATSARPDAVAEIRCLLGADRALT